jgi:polyferredoxin
MLLTMFLSIIVFCFIGIWREIMNRFFGKSFKPFPWRYIAYFIISWAIVLLIFWLSGATESE